MKLVGERRALAAIVFAFFFIMFALNALMGPGPNAPMLYALAGCYGLAFFSLVAGYFWARWYSLGIGLFGVILGVLGIWQGRKDPEHIDMWQIYMQFGMHLAATLMLWGENMSQTYDGKTAWREKLHMDDNAVQRLGKSVIRAGVSLPIVLVYALAPKQPAMAHLAGGLAVLGIAGSIRMRTWGLVMMGVSGIALATLGIENVSLAPTLAGGLLLSATVPFLAPMARLIRA
jgi:hypothetical protein